MLQMEAEADKCMFPERSSGDTFRPFNESTYCSSWVFVGSTEFIPYIKNPPTEASDNVIKFRIINIKSKNVSDNQARTFHESKEEKDFRSFGFDNVHDRMKKRRPEAFEEKVASPGKANCDIRLAFRHGNMFIVKKFFTFGLRQTKDEVHVIQTSSAPILYFCPRDSRAANAMGREIPGAFYTALQNHMVRHVLQPWSIYEVPRNTPYLIITYQKTFFSLDVFSSKDDGWRSLVIGSSPKNPNQEFTSIEEKFPPMRPCVGSWSSHRLSQPSAENNYQDSPALVGPSQNLNCSTNKSQRYSNLSNISTGNKVSVICWNDHPFQNLQQSPNESRRENPQMFPSKTTSSNVPSVSNTVVDSWNDPSSPVVPSQNLNYTGYESERNSTLSNVPSGSSAGTHNQTECQQDSANSTKTIMSFSATTIKPEQFSIKSKQSQRDSILSASYTTTTKFCSKKELKLDPMSSVVLSERSHGTMQLTSCPNESLYSSTLPEKSTTIKQPVLDCNESQEDLHSTLPKSSANSNRQNEVSQDLSPSTTNHLEKSANDQDRIPPVQNRYFWCSERYRRNNFRNRNTPFSSPGDIQKHSDQNSRERPT